MPVGNDIVDLRDPESAPESLHPRYLHRVFTAVERRELAAHPGRLELWSRWAAKEAAYKALVSERAAAREKLVFAPRAFATVLEPPGSGSGPGTHRRGWVVHRVLGARLPIRLYSTDEAIHAVAASAGELEGEGDKLLAAAFRLDSQVRDLPSVAVRRAARGLFAQHLGCDKRRVQVRGRRPPQFYFDGQPGASSLSLSHHGRWAAFAFSRVSPWRRRQEPSPDGRSLQI